MSKRPVSAIIKDWHKKSIRQDRKTPSQIRKLIQQDPNSFEARLHTSPYGKCIRKSNRLLYSDVVVAISFYISLATSKMRLS